MTSDELAHAARNLAHSLGIPVYIRPDLPARAGRRVLAAKWRRLNGGRRSLL